MPDAISDQVVRLKQRFTSLDAVRGLAACSVVLSHCVLLLPEHERERIDGSIGERLLLPLFNGNAAVIIFFALSGYVLSLPYLRGTQLPYGQFVIRRLSRIYLPFAASIVLALGLFAAMSHPPTAGASQWFAEVWPSSWPGGTVLAGHFLMVGTEPDMQLNAPMWTLVYEIRLSLLFPLVILLCRNTGVAIATSLLLLAGSIKLIIWSGQNSHPSYATAFWATLVWTANVVPFFATGVLLSKHRIRIAQWFSRLPTMARPLLFIIPYAVFTTAPGLGSVRGDVFYDLAAALVIVLAVESPGLRTLLDTPVPQFLGRISYSLYLVHLPLMMVLVPMLLGRVPFAVLVVVIMAVSISAGTLIHAVVEVPAIWLGHHLTGGPSRERIIRPA